MSPISRSTKRCLYPRLADCVVLLLLSVEEVRAQHARQDPPRLQARGGADLQSQEAGRGGAVQTGEVPSRDWNVLECCPVGYGSSVQQGAGLPSSVERPS